MLDRDEIRALAAKVAGWSETVRTALDLVNATSARPWRRPIAPRLGGGWRVVQTCECGSAHQPPQRRGGNTARDCAFGGQRGPLRDGTFYFINVFICLFYFLIFTLTLFSHFYLTFLFFVKGTPFRVLWA